MNRILPHTPVAWFSMALLLTTCAKAHPGRHSEVEGEGEGEGFSRAECMAWVDELYQMAPLTEELEIDRAAEIEEARECMQDNVVHMAVPIPQTWCDNIFKIHCSGLDLLAEIGDALVDRCEDELEASLGVDIGDNPAWNSCAEQKVFDRYSRQGQASDLAACRSILLEECGADLGE